MKIAVGWMLLTWSAWVHTAQPSTMVFHHGQSGVINPAAWVQTLHNHPLKKDWPLAIVVPDGWSHFPYVTLIAAATQRTGGWRIQVHLDGPTLAPCLQAPPRFSAVTMALTTPYVIVGHREAIELRALDDCSVPSHRPF